MRDHVRASFRNAPHTSGVAHVKPRDFLPSPELLDPADSVDASTPYAAWHELLGTDRPLVVGDMLESTLDGNLFLCKYVGFERAEWVLPEVVAPLDPLAASPAVAPMEVAPEQVPVSR